MDHQERECPLWEYVTGQNYNYLDYLVKLFKVKVKFRLTKVDSQFRLSSSPNYSYIRASRQRKLRINRGQKISTQI